MRNIEELIKLVQTLIDVEMDERIIILAKANLNVEEQAFVINQLMDLISQLCKKLF